MKKFIFFICLFGVTMASAQRVPDNEFHIEGRVTGLRDGIVIWLSKFSGGVGWSIARDTICDGRFSFIVPMTEKAELSFIFRDEEEFPDTSRHIWATPGEKITITGDGKLYATWNFDSRVSEQHESDAYIIQSKDLFVLDQQISIEKSRASISNNKPAWDSLSVKSLGVNLAIMRNNIVLMDRTPVSKIWLDKLKGVAMMVANYEDHAVALRDDALRLYERLSPAERELPVAQTIKNYLFPLKKVGVGDAMADAELKAFDGSTHRLSDYLGKYVILDFWATGCGPCLKSMPELKALGEKYPDTVKIIGINLDASEEVWRAGTEMYKPSELNLNAPPSSDIDKRYGVRGIPHYVILSPGGVILESWSGYREGGIEQRLTSHMNKAKNVISFTIFAGK
jgi:thiol-disulfide isomerase/thioredoxin